MKRKFEPYHQQLTMVVDLNERGWFKAHVENQNGKTIFELNNEAENGWPSDDGLWLVEHGWMKHCHDKDGLLKYLRHIGVAKPTATMNLIP